MRQRMQPSGTNCPSSLRNTPPSSSPHKGEGKGGGKAFLLEKSSPLEKIRESPRTCPIIMSCFDCAQHPLNKKRGIKTYAFLHPFFLGARERKSRWPWRRGPPLTIPNREVKPVCADGTALPGGRVGRRLSLNPDHLLDRDFFCSKTHFFGVCSRRDYFLSDSYVNTQRLFHIFIID